MSSQFALLRTKRFLPLFVTQFLGAFNDNVFNALVILITYHAAGKVSVDPRQLVTASAGIFILPFFLFSATAGQLADKFDKALLIRIIKALEIVLMLMASVGFYLESYYGLLGVLFLGGVHSTFFGPLKYSILPVHLKQDELVGGNAFVEAGTFIAILLGTILGGITILKDNGDMIVSIVLLAAAVLGWLSSRGIPVAPAGSPGLKVSVNFMAETWRMIKHARKQESVFLSIIGISWFWLLGFTFLAQFPVYAKDVIGADPGVVTLFLTVFSVGIAIGSLICNKMLDGRVSSIYVPLGSFGMTLAIFVIWLVSPKVVPHPALIGVGQFLMSFTNWQILTSLLAIAISGGIYIVPLYTIMQVRCEESHRSRTIAVNNILNALFMVAGAGVTMALLKLNLTVTEIFLALGVANIPVTFVVRKIVHARNSRK